MTITLDVATLTPRVAHAVHALMAVRDTSTSGPFVTSEICVYDASWEALSPRHTAQALRQAQKVGLAIYAGRGIWIPTNLAMNNRKVFEERYLKDEEEANV